MSTNSSIFCSVSSCPKKKEVLLNMPSFQARLVNFHGFLCSKEESGLLTGHWQLYFPLPPVTGTLFYFDLVHTSTSTHMKPSPVPPANEICHWIWQWLEVTGNKQKPSGTFGKTEYTWQTKTEQRVNYIIMISFLPFDKMVRLFDKLIRLFTFSLTLSEVDNRVF